MQLVEIIGWTGTIVLLSAYFLNINGKLKSTSVLYILGNIIGGLLFTIYTYARSTYPNMVVNIIWVFIAVAALMKKDKRRGNGKKP